MTPDVLVIGAGPVGLTMAAELTRYGVAVRIIDKSAARTDKSKALVVWSRTLELLDRAACGTSFVAAGSTPKFALFAELETEPDELITRYGNLVKPRPRPRLAESAIRLVRPDGYIAMIANAGEWGAVEAYFAKVARASEHDSLTRNNSH